MKLIQTFVVLYLVHVTSGWIRFRYPLSRRNFLQQTAMEMLQNCAGNPEEQCRVCGEAPNELPTELIPTKDFQLVNASDGPIDIGLGFRQNIQGYLEVRLCKLGPNPLANADRCRKVAPLKIFDNFRYIPGNEQNSARLQITLPPDIACERCILQVKYVPGLESSLAGQTYFDCALVRIPSNTNSLRVSGRIVLLTDRPLTSDPALNTPSPDVSRISAPSDLSNFKSSEAVLDAAQFSVTPKINSTLERQTVGMAMEQTSTPTTSLATLPSLPTLSSVRETSNRILGSGTFNQAVDTINFENVFTSETRSSDKLNDPSLSINNQHQDITNNANIFNRRHNDNTNNVNLVNGRQDITNNAHVSDSRHHDDTNNVNVLYSRHKDNTLNVNAVDGRHRENTNDANVFDGRHQDIINNVNLANGRHQANSNKMNVVDGRQLDNTHNVNVVEGRHKETTNNVNIFDGRHQGIINHVNEVKGIHQRDSNKINVFDVIQRDTTNNVNVFAGRQQGIPNNDNMVDGRHQVNTNNVNLANGRHQANSNDINVVGGRQHDTTNNVNVFAGRQQGILYNDNVVDGKHQVNTNNVNLGNGRHQANSNNINVVGGRQHDTTNNVNVFAGRQQGILNNDNVVDGRHQVNTDNVNLANGRQQANSNNINVVGGRRHETTKNVNVFAGRQQGILNNDNVVDGKHQVNTNNVNLGNGRHQANSHDINVVGGRQHDTTNNVNVFAGRQQGILNNDNVVNGRHQVSTNNVNVADQRNQDIINNANVVKGIHPVNTNKVNIFDEIQHYITNNVIGVNLRHPDTTNNVNAFNAIHQDGTHTVNVFDRRHQENTNNGNVVNGIHQDNINNVNVVNEMHLDGTHNVNKFGGRHQDYTNNTNEQTRIPQDNTNNVNVFDDRHQDTNNIVNVVNGRFHDINNNADNAMHVQIVGNDITTTDVGVNGIHRDVSYNSRKVMHEQILSDQMFGPEITTADSVVLGGPIRIQETSTYVRNIPDASVNNGQYVNSLDPQPGMIQGSQPGKQVEIQEATTPTVLNDAALTSNTGNESTLFINTTNQVPKNVTITAKVNTTTVEKGVVNWQDIYDIYDTTNVQGGSANDIYYDLYTYSEIPNNIGNSTGTNDTVSSNTRNVISGLTNDTLVSMNETSTDVFNNTDTFILNIETTTTSTTQQLDATKPTTTSFKNAIGGPQQITQQPYIGNEISTETLNRSNETPLYPDFMTGSFYDSLYDITTTTANAINDTASPSPNVMELMFRTVPTVAPQIPKVNVMTEVTSSPPSLAINGTALTTTYNIPIINTIGETTQINIQLNDTIDVFNTTINTVDPLNALINETLNDTLPLETNQQIVVVSDSLFDRILLPTSKPNQNVVKVPDKITVFPVRPRVRLPTQPADRFRATAQVPTRPPVYTMATITPFPPYVTMGFDNTRRYTQMSETGKARGPFVNPTVHDQHTTQFAMRDTTQFYGEISTSTFKPMIPTATFKTRGSIWTIGQDTYPFSEATTEKTPTLLQTRIPLSVVNEIQNIPTDPIYSNNIQTSTEQSIIDSTNFDMNTNDMIITTGKSTYFMPNSRITQAKTSDRSKSLKVLDRIGTSNNLLEAAVVNIQTISNNPFNQASVSEMKSVRGKSAKDTIVEDKQMFPFSGISRKDSTVGIKQMFPKSKTPLILASADITSDRSAKSNPDKVTNTFSRGTGTNKGLRPINDRQTTSTTNHGGHISDMKSYFPDITGHVDGIGGVPVQPGMFIDIFVPKFGPNLKENNIIHQEGNGPTDQLPTVSSADKRGSMDLLLKGLNNRMNLSNDLKSANKIMDSTIKAKKTNFVNPSLLASNAGRTTFGQFTRKTLPTSTASWGLDTRMRFNENNKRSGNEFVNQFSNSLPQTDIDIVKKNVRNSGNDNKGSEIIINSLAAPEIMPPIFVSKESKTLPPIIIPKGDKRRPHKGNEKSTISQAQQGSSSFSIDKMLSLAHPYSISGKQEVSSNIVWKGPGVSSESDKSFGFISGPLTNSASGSDQSTANTGTDDFFGATGPVYIPINDISIPWNNAGGEVKVLSTPDTNVSKIEQINNTFSTLWDVNRLNRNRDKDSGVKFKEGFDQVMPPYIGIPLVWSSVSSADSKTRSTETPNAITWNDLPVPKIMPPIRVNLLNRTSKGTSVDNKSVPNSTENVNQQILHKLETIVGELQRNREILTHSFDGNPVEQQELQLSFDKFPGQFTRFDVRGQRDTSGLNRLNGQRFNVLSEVMQDPVHKTQKVTQDMNGNTLSSNAPIIHIDPYLSIDPRGNAPISEANIGSLMHSGNFNLLNMLGISEIRPLDTGNIQVTFNETATDVSNINHTVVGAEIAGNSRNQTVIDVDVLGNNTFATFTDALKSLQENSTTSEQRSTPTSFFTSTDARASVTNSNITPTEQAIVKFTRPSTTFTTGFTNNRPTTTNTGQNIFESISVTSPSSQMTTISKKMNPLIGFDVTEIARQPESSSPTEQTVIDTTMVGNLNITEFIGLLDFNKTTHSVFDESGRNKTRSNFSPIINSTGIEKINPFEVMNVENILSTTDTASRASRVPLGITATMTSMLSESQQSTISGQKVASVTEIITAANDRTDYNKHRKSMTTAESLKDQYVRQSFNDRLKGIQSISQKGRGSRQNHLDDQFDLNNVFTPVNIETKVKPKDAKVFKTDRLNVPTMSEISVAPTISERVITVTEEPMETPIIEKQFFLQKGMLSALVNGGMNLGTTTAKTNVNGPTRRLVNSAFTTTPNVRDDMNYKPINARIRPQTDNANIVHTNSIKAITYPNEQALSAGSIKKIRPAVGARDRLPNTYSNGQLLPPVICPEDQLFVCKAVGDYSYVPGMVWWCFSHCKKGTCPEEKCKCTCEIGQPNANQNGNGAAMKRDSSIRENVMDATITRDNSVRESDRVREKTFIKLTLNGSEEAKIALPVDRTSSGAKSQMLSKTGNLVITKYSKSTQKNVKPIQAVSSLTGIPALIESVPLPIVAITPVATGSSPSFSTIGNSLMLESPIRMSHENRILMKRPIMNEKLRCKGINAFAGKPEIDTWCTRNCNRNVCPPDLCSCDNRGK